MPADMKVVEIYPARIIRRNFGVNEMGRYRIMYYEISNFLEANFPHRYVIAGLTLNMHPPSEIGFYDVEDRNFFLLAYGGDYSIDGD
jgi:hypothetical protein